MAKKSMIQREIKRKGLVNRFLKKRVIIKQKLKSIMSSSDKDNLYTIEDGKKWLEIFFKSDQFPIFLSIW